MDAADPALRELASLLERAESLAWSTDWRQTAKEMRLLRERWSLLEQQSFSSLEREWITRFRAAQQTFMDRRADYFQQGNLRKGSGLIAHLEQKQESVIQLKEEIQNGYVALQEFEARLQATPDDGHAMPAIRAFIGDSIVDLKEEIQRKERDLARIERSMMATSNRYYCVE
ncbi:MAG: hypothetical protein HQL91_01030 [Magnetococcales bacterium]|nr:hypothetical protein [Magnetococcales bacterium]